MRVLLVDREDTARLLEKRINWKGMGVEEVCTANSIREAKALLFTIPFDIVISEVYLPGENGLELMRWLDERNGRIIKMLLTGCQEFACAAEALRCGVFYYLLKPLDEKELWKAMKNAAVELQRWERLKSCPLS